MAGGKETPRQKMIGMMYLVLTALLALNISKDILNAFVTINESLLKTNGNFDTKNDVTSNAFAVALLNNETKTKPYADAAKAIRSKSKDLDKFIADLKSELVMHVEGFKDKKIADTTKLVNVNSKDNYDIPTHQLIGDDPEKATGLAVELKKRINDYRSDILGIIKKQAPKKYTEFEKGLGLKTDRVYSLFEEMEVSWENNLFYHVPLAADIAHLSRIQNEIKNCEGDAINLLYNEISAADFKFDKVGGRVIANSNYILVGSDYHSEIFLAAYSSTQNPTVYLCEIDTATNMPKKGGTIDSTSVKVSNGVGIYDLKPGSEGLQKYSGLIKIKAPDGTPKYYPFNTEYMVARPAAAVSPDKMNVFYIGVDNPVTISAAGVAPSDLQPSMQGGSLSKSAGPGQYIVRVTGGTEAHVNVGAKVNGTQTNMGSFKFRVKRVPDPVAFFAGKKGDDKIGKGELTVTPGVIAKLENFDFDLKFDVKSFDISMAVNGGIAVASSSSNRVTPEQQNLLKNAKTGTKVYIENVRAMGPDGTMRKIPGVNLKVQ